MFSYSVEATEDEVNAAAAAALEGGSYGTRRKNAEDHVVETIRAIVVSGSENKRYFEEEGVKSEGEVGSTWVAVKVVGFLFSSLFSLLSLLFLSFFPGEKKKKTLLW